VSIRIGFVTAPIFVAIVWNAAFKTSDVAGRGLFAVVAIEYGHPVEGLCPFVLIIFPLTQENPVSVCGGGVFKVAQLAYDTSASTSIFKNLPSHQPPPQLKSAKWPKGGRHAGKPGNSGRERPAFFTV
jgi:hypothetical protein